MNQQDQFKTFQGKRKEEVDYLEFVQAVIAHEKEHANDVEYIGVTLFKKIQSKR